LQLKERPASRQVGLFREERQHPINGGAEAFQRLAPVEVDEAAARSGLPFQSAMSSAEQMPCLVAAMSSAGQVLHLIAFGLPRGQALGHFFGVGAVQIQAQA
jgi:hypothetical protein